MIDVGRFSQTPSISDFDHLVIDNGDLYALWKATPGDSQIKLSEDDIRRIREATDGAVRMTPPVKELLSAEYKSMLLRRLTDYLNDGNLSASGYADKDQRVNAQQVFERLAQEQAATPGTCPHFAYLSTATSLASQSASTGFFYWAKERFGELKPVINLIQVLIHKEGFRTFIVSKQMYSSHYTEAGLSVAEFIPFTDESGRPRTLVVYTIRMELDMLGGTLGFLKKRMVEPRLLATLKDSLSGLRRNLETAGLQQTAQYRFLDRKVAHSRARSNGFCNRYAGHSSAVTGRPEHENEPGNEAGLG